MNGNKSKNLLKTVAGLIGGVSAGVLVCLPALALSNFSQSNLNQSLNVESDLEAEQFLAQTQPGEAQPAETDTDTDTDNQQPAQTAPGTAQPTDTDTDNDNDDDDNDNDTTGVTQPADQGVRALW